MTESAAASEAGHAREIALLGAGASIEAGVPASFEMTEKLVEAVGQRSGSRLAQALHFVCGALVGYDAAGGTSPYRGLDVERVFAAVELLAERRTLEVTPFVESWHPAVDTWDRAALPAFFDRDLQRAVLKTEFNRARNLVVGLIESVTGTGTGKTYRSLAEQMIEELRTLLVIEPGRERYLKPLVEAARRPGGLTVATLNYDLAVETLADEVGIGVHTGISSWASERKWGWPEEGLRLLKLHGSIDWQWQRSEYVEGQMEHTWVAQSVEDGRNDGAPAVVFGQRTKLRAQGPFLSLLAEFEAFLARSERLIVIGYSFRDVHINEAIRYWVTRDSARAITIIDPHFPATPDFKEFRGELLSSLNPRGLGDPNVAATPPRVQVLRLPTGQALEQLFGSDRSVRQST